MRTAYSTSFLALSRSSVMPARPPASHVYLSLPASVTLPSFVLPSHRTWPLYARSQTGFAFLDVRFNCFPMLPHPVATAFGFARIHQQLEGLAHLLQVL